MSTTLIKATEIVNEGKIETADVYIKDGRIERIGTEINGVTADFEIDAEGQYLIPGIIDDQVHFREPGLTGKADIKSEARAAVAGGVTSFMEMPNTKPPALNRLLLEEKYGIASRSSLANYSFYMGVSNDNLDEVLATEPKDVCGIKIFLGSSTGNLVVDNQRTIENLFAQAHMLIAAHCEDEQTIKANLAQYSAKYGDEIPMEFHPFIRSVEACYKSSEFAVGLAKKHGTRLHVLHISTEEELELFSNKLPLKDKKITAEVCVHHLFFDSEDYEKHRSLIKCNPAIKEKRHKKALLQALLDDRLDVVATDHAPHTLDEKHNPYMQSPSGIPLVQHSLNIMIEFYHRKQISLEKIVEKMCHAPADMFRIKGRGYIREGYQADLVLVDLQAPSRVEKDNIFYKCGWSPLENKIFNSTVTHTFVNGNLVYKNEPYQQSKPQFYDDVNGQRLVFER